MNSFLNKDGLIHFSNKIKDYISNKIKKLETDISTLDTKVDSDKIELKTQIDESKKYVISQISDEVKVVNNKIQGVDTKVNTLKETVDSIEYSPMSGDTIGINTVEQYVFNNVNSGEIIEIPNSTNSTDFMIECYTDVGVAPEIEYSIINLNSSTIDTFTYDDRYVEVTEFGIKPKDTIILSYTKVDEVIDDVNYTYYISDCIPDELLTSLDSIISIEEI